jgi:HAE1 family hydrophobic/amphiphilic exporter-1
LNLASLSIRRPIFISCVVILMLIVGYVSLKKLPVDLFPDVTIPVVVVRTTYPGAGPEEIETQISKPLEDEISSVAGIDTLRSVNTEGLSQVIVEFDLKVDIKYAEQQIRDRVAAAKKKFPDGYDEPLIRSVDPSDSPILVVSLSADLSDGALYDLADQVIKPRLTQVDKVGQIDILGGRKREIQVQLDRAALQSREISATQVSKQVGSAGKNVPLGKLNKGDKEAVFRAVGEFRDLDTISATIVRFSGNENPITVGNLGRVVDTLTDETSRTFVNGKKSVQLSIFRQSKANTIEVVDKLKKKVDAINEEMKIQKGAPALAVVRDGSSKIRANVDDVNESILIGIVLTIIVVYFFLGSGRSTFITGLALPNSLLGAFILMLIAGFSINIMSLLALSLAVGLLIDDAIVVRENIFRHVEMGKSPHEASLVGTQEVTLAVIATTFTILAVFGPIGFLQGIVGQYLKEFGLTICFAMLISLFDALTIAPMLSAYFAAPHTKKIPKFFLSRWNEKMLKGFDHFQTWLEDCYERILHFVLRRPLIVIIGNVAIFVVCLMLMRFIPKTFLPPQDNGEVSVDVDLPPGTSLDAMNELAGKIDLQVRSNKEVAMTVLTVGNENGESNSADLFIKLVPSRERKVNTSQFKDILRGQMKPYAYANPQVGDGQSASNSGGGTRPFNINIVGSDLKVIEDISTKLVAKLRDNPALKDVDTSYRPGKPELQVLINNERARAIGIQTGALGFELRTQVQGDTPAIFRDQDREYDVRVRMKEDQRDLKEAFRQILVPNINGNMVPLAAVARPVDASGPATILRSNRSRFIQISADVAPKGPGMGGAMKDASALLAGELKLPPGTTYSFEGQSKRFGELMTNMAVAMGLGILFIYFVLASLYESFITPFAIMLVFPLAICGAILGLLFSGQSLDLFSMIGCVMLLGLATKNSILLVDYANQRLKAGATRSEAILEAGRTRLRPILMTTFALIAGMIPVAVGLNEASKQRVSLGNAIIGGTISSTVLTLVVVPAAYSYIDRFREWVNKLFFRYIGTRDHKDGDKRTSVSKSG